MTIMRISFAQLSAFAILLTISASISLKAQEKTFPAPKEIVSQIVQDSDLNDLIEVRPDGTSPNLVAYDQDLNGDGSPELVVHGMEGICGAANCDTWVFGRNGHSYSMLLDAGAIQDIEPQKNSSGGYVDLMTSMHGSALTSDQTLYKFNGVKYVPVACYSRTYRLKGKASKTPIITKRKCD
jgi:hypothetical protein